MSKMLKYKGVPLSIPYAVKVSRKWYRRTSFGIFKFGLAGYGAMDDYTGIYQQRKCIEGKITVREKLYSPRYSETEAIQASREKFRNAIIAYQALTVEQKLIYHKRAVGKKFSGYNLFIIEFMQS